MPVSDVLSVDVEDYFQVDAFSQVVSPAQWDRYPSRVSSNTHRVLDLMDECGVRGTFFILGWIADRYPALVREIVTRGHEPACHSYWHRRVYTLDPEEFRKDTLRAKAAIEQACGREIHGYRAPSFSLTARSLWAAEILVESGFDYDSSIFPIYHDVYGMREAPRRPFRLRTASGWLSEYPLGTCRLHEKVNLPVGGGGYLRILPFWYTRFCLARLRAEGTPLIAYVHPWELDAEQPRLEASLKSRLRHYTGLRGMQTKLLGLIRLGRFTSFQAIQTEQSSAAGKLEVIDVRCHQRRHDEGRRAVLEPDRS